MKIAILTLPLHANYGGILQAYALQTVLTKIGHNVEVLQKNPEKLSFSLQSAYKIIKRLGVKILKDWRTPLFLEKKNEIEKPIIEQNTSQFISKYIKLRRIDSLSDIIESDYDAIIVGSDQVWRAPYFKKMWNAPIRDAFLDFTKGWNIRRVSYAASFGIDNLDEYSNLEIEQCKKSIANFNLISVRETSGINICKERFNVSAIQLQDPTMLIDMKDYISLVKVSNEPKSPGDLLCYILDNTEFKNIVIKKIAEEKQLLPFHVNSNFEDIHLSVEKRVQPPVESWLRGFMDARYVITDSFHACVFSIIFRKPFIVIGNSERGLSRFKSLLSTFKLQDRIIYNKVQLDEIQLDFDMPLYDPSKFRDSLIQFLSFVDE